MKFKQALTLKGRRRQLDIPTPSAGKGVSRDGWVAGMDAGRSLITYLLFTWEAQTEIALPGSATEADVWHMCAL